MGALSPILRSVEGGRVYFWCPGCNMAHQVRLSSDAGGNWGYNGNPDAPTFTPSILVTGTIRMSDAEHAEYMKTKILPEPVPFTCHSFVTDGQIQFLGDCTHALANQTVPIPSWPA